MMRHGLGGLVVSMLVSCGGPGGDEDADPVRRFCAAAAAAPSCDPAATCEDRFQQGKVMNPLCHAQYDEFAGCLADLELACVDGPDFEIHASGDGSPPDILFDVVPIYLFYVHDTACREIGSGLADCILCAGVPGFPGGRGIGDRCSDADPCTDGLDCRFGMCTKACGDNFDCRGANAATFQCLNEFGLENYCDLGLCTSASHVDNDFCGIYGDGWIGSGEESGFGHHCYHP